MKNRVCLHNLCKTLVVNKMMITSGGNDDYLMLGRYRKLEEDRGQYSVCYNHAAKLMSSISIYLLLSPFIYKASELAKVKYQICTICSENPGKTLKLWRQKFCLHNCNMLIGRWLWQLWRQNRFLIILMWKCFLEHKDLFYLCRTQAASSSRVYK